ncbi:hypothetical protein HDU76_009091, partial [Blyttiomyces sp. JEL0837]
YTSYLDTLNPNLLFQFLPSTSPTSIQKQFPLEPQFTTHEFNTYLHCLTKQYNWLHLPSISLTIHLSKLGHEIPYCKKLIMELDSSGGYLQSIQEMEYKDNGGWFDVVPEICFGNEECGLVCLQWDRDDDDEEEDGLALGREDENQFDVLWNGPLLHTLIGRVNDRMIDIAQRKAQTLIT